MTTPFTDPSYEAEQSAIERRRRMIDALMAPQARQGQIGGLAIPTSGAETVARVLAQALGMYAGNQNDQAGKALGEKYQADQSAKLSQALVDYDRIRKGGPAMQPVNDDEGNPMPPAPNIPGDPRAANMALVNSGLPMLQQFGMGAMLKEDKPPEPFTLKPGETRYGIDGKPIVSQPVKPEGPKLGEVRKFDSGDKQLAQEWTGTEWKTIGEGPRWQAPQADRTLVEVQDPNNPSRTIMVPRDQAVGKAGAQSVSAGRQVREDVDGLRKEFSSQPVVKTVNEIAPIIESARKAPNTPQGDFALIYGVGKVLDPNSVVREGEMNMVIKAGSPAQRVEGFLSQIRGGGRLTPEMRNQLLQILDARAGEYQQQYMTARKSFEDIATRRGYNPSDIFVGSVPAAATPASADGLSPAERKELEELRKKLNR